MRCRLFAALAVVSLGTIMGCGGGSDSASPTAVASASGSAPSDPIAQVVFEFFDAVRQGQMEAAKQRLTPLALQRITERNMSIAPPGSPTASFRVGKVLATMNDHALVALTWSDVDVDGKPYSESIHCQLRTVDGQWRICGMAQDMGPDRPPMVMDFEAPEAAATATAAAAAGQPAAGTASADGVAPPKEVAENPFEQPVQR